MDQQQPRRCKSMEELYSKVLRVKRREILTELPDTSALLRDQRLGRLFTDLEKIEATSQKSPFDNSEKFIRVLECKGYDAYDTFIAVLRDHRPSLAQKLTAAGEEFSRMDNNVPRGNINQDHDGQEEEDAGCFHFNNPGNGPRDHISSLSIASREYLSQNINPVFKTFCQAMAVDPSLVKICLRSGNPTGYLLQEMNSDGNATLDRLETALEGIGKRDLFDSILQLNGKM